MRTGAGGIRRRGLVALLLGAAACLQGGEAAGADPRLEAWGRAIAEGGELGHELTCSRCHGVLGIGRPEEGAPRLAAQPLFYLRKQLEDFARGARRSAKMQPVASSLTEEQRLAVAAYYDSLRGIFYPPAPYGPPEMVRHGGVLSAVGDLERDIRACEMCHADAGVGIAPSFPYLAGQDADYTERQLLAWQAGERANDPLAVMAEIAKAMSGEEIRAVALYFARVRPPSAALSSPIPAEPIPPPPDSPSLPD